MPIVSPNRVFLPGNRNRANAYPPSVATTVVMTTVINVTTSELVM